MCFAHLVINPLYILMAWWFVWNSDLNLHFSSSTSFMNIKGWKGKKRRMCWQKAAASS
jgi:hypothetical protein